jgi:hypothetical protein
VGTVVRAAQVALRHPWVTAGSVLAVATFLGGAAGLAVETNLAHRRALRLKEA